MAFRCESMRQELSRTSRSITTPEQADEVFARVRPRLAVYSHAPSADRVITQTRKTYAGPLRGAEDLLTIEIGQKIDIRRFVQ